MFFFWNFWCTAILFRCNATTRCPIEWFSWLGTVKCTICSCPWLIITWCTTCKIYQICLLFFFPSFFVLVCYSTNNNWHSLSHSVVSSAHFNGWNWTFKLYNNQLYWLQRIMGNRTNITGITKWYTKSTQVRGCPRRETLKHLQKKMLYYYSREVRLWTFQL